MKPLNLAVLLFCLIAYGHSRPSDNDEHDEIIRDAKRDNKHFQHLSRPQHRGFADNAEDAVQAVPFYGSGKGKFLVIHPSGKTTVEDHRPPNSVDVPREDEEDVGQEDESSAGSDASPAEPPESVSVNLPPDNASVAEAKPVGLAIAGPGGVASSKPVATAVVGPGGLALAKPVATAIAGIPGAEALVGVASNGGKHRQKAAAAAAAAAASTPLPTKAAVKTKRSAGPRGSVASGNAVEAASATAQVWPTYPLYKIPESHAWGFILRPVYGGNQYVN